MLNEAQETMVMLELWQLVMVEGQLMASKGSQA